MPIATKTRYGDMKLLSHDSVVSQSLELYGEWAQKEIDFISRFIGPGGTAVDIGAFIGTHTLAFSALVGPLGHIISFEPRREAFRLLQENTEINNKKNIDLRNLGAGDKDDTIRLQFLDSDESANVAGLSLKDRPADDTEFQYTIKIVRLDEQDLDSVDFIKIDVEGMEREVLDGATATIQRSRPVIFAECNSISAGLKILEWSKLYAYECFGHLSDAFNPGNFKGETKNIFGSSKELNFLLLPAEKFPDFLDRESPPIDNADDIAAVLLHKPQYPHEVLKNANRTLGLGLQYPAPSASDLQIRLEDKCNEFDSMHHRYLDLVERHAETLEQKINAIAELSDAWDELQLRYSKIHSLTMDNQFLKAEIVALRNSRSWRFSAPLRLGGRALRSIRRRA